MTRWVIKDVAKGIAADTIAASSSDWMREGQNNDVRGSIKAAELEVQIRADIETLVDAGHIHPRIPDSNERAPKGVPLDPIYWLTRDDLEKVKQYVRGDAQSKQAFLEEFAERIATGRYTLAQAADLMDAEGSERYEHILERLKQAARNGELPMYEPGRNQRLQYRDSRLATAVRDFYEEAYWNDLNTWLETFDQRIPWRFPDPSKDILASPAPPTNPSTGRESMAIIDSEEIRLTDETTPNMSQKRRDILDPPIDQAIASAGGHDRAAVFLKLKELALSGEPPFKGLVDEGGGLEYTDAKNKLRTFSQKSLSKRLKRRMKAALKNR